jgi:CTP:molybdopterin cytidylyltransferase MocA
MKPEEGRTGSIQCGIKELESERCLIVPVDRPGFSNKTIEKLINSEETSCPSKNGKGGHPVILSRKDCERILSSDPSTPLRDIIEPIKIEVNDKYLHLNIDFPEDLEKLREITREHNL